LRLYTAYLALLKENVEAKGANKANLLFELISSNLFHMPV